MTKSLKKEIEDWKAVAKQRAARAEFAEEELKMQTTTMDYFRIV